MTTTRAAGPHPTVVLAGRPAHNLRTIRPLLFAWCRHPACDWFIQDRDAFAVRTAARAHQGDTLMATTITDLPRATRLRDETTSLAIGWQWRCTESRCGETIERLDDPERESAKAMVETMADEHLLLEHPQH